jgi:hypothetical protein
LQQKRSGTIISGGQTQRAFLGQAFSVTPPLLGELCRHIPRKTLLANATLEISACVLVVRGRLHEAKSGIIAARAACESRSRFEADLHEARNVGKSGIIAARAACKSRSRFEADEARAVRLCNAQISLVSGEQELVGHSAKGCPPQALASDL